MAEHLDLEALDFSRFLRVGDGVAWGQGGAEPVPLTAALMSQRHAIGAFKVSFDVPTAFDPCLESLRITAVGARGSDAALKLPQRACPPAP